VSNDLDRYTPSSGSMLGSARSGESLADVLERVLDKGVVIAGDIKINLLDIELLTIKVRLLIASADKAKEMGIDWWAHDPELSSRAGRKQAKRIDGRTDKGDPDGSGDHRGDGEAAMLRDRVERLEAQLKALTSNRPGDGGAGARAKGERGSGSAHR
jgi:hypothetical protein